MKQMLQFMPARARVVLLSSLILFVLGLLNPAHAGIPADKVGRFAVGRMTQPPTIDGTIDEQEWQRATAIAGVAQQNPGGNLLVMRPTTFYVGWDEDNLYLACRTWVMPGYKPRVKGRKPGAASAFDDGLEIALHPKGANVPSGRTDSAYKFMMNCLGVLGERARMSVGQMFRTWSPDFERSYRLTAPGSAPKGGRWWEAELVLPAAAFELTGKNRPGDVWKALLGFNHMPVWMQAAVPIASSYVDSGGWPELVLVDEAPAAQVRMEELPGALDGRFAAEVTVHNPSDQPAQVRVRAALLETGATQRGQIDSATLEEVWTKDRTLNIAGGRTAAAAFDQPIPDAVREGVGALALRVTAGERVLYDYFVYLKQGYADKWVKAKPNEAPFGLSASFNPVRSNLLLTVDTYEMPDPSVTRAASYRIVRHADGKADGKEVAAGRITERAYFYYERLIDLPPLRPGKYTIKAAVHTADGSTLGPLTKTFTKRNEREAFAAWWDNDLGPTDRVIWPFEAVERDGSAVTVWGRTYELGALGLPRRIVSQAGAVLAKPARLIVERDGETHAVRIDEGLTFTQTQDHITRFRGEAQAAGVTFAVRGSVAQDGLVMLELSYAPEASEPVKLDAVRLEFPLAPSAAEMLLCTGVGGNFAPITAEALPLDERGRLWSTLEMGRGGSGMTVGNFYPSVWLGNERRGFSWWADSDEGWVPNDDVAAHEVIRTDEAVVLRNNLIGAPHELKQKRTVTLSYNASPFRPRPAGWRATINSEDGTFIAEHKRWTDPQTGEKYFARQILSPPGPPETWDQAWASYKPHAERKVRTHRPTDPLRARRKHYVHTSVALMNYGPLTADKATAQYFKPEWGANTHGKVQRDYMTWLAHKAFKEGGLNTLYWDIYFVQNFDTLQNGMGYKLPDGRVQPTFNGFNLRKLSMRIQSLAMDHGLQPGVLMNHNTNNYVLVGFPWLDATLDGEWAFIKEGTEQDWVDFYPAQRMRAILPQNFGPVVTWMERIYDRDRKGHLYRGYMDWARLHDATWYYWDGPRYGPTPKMIDWGLAHKSLTYHPYWRDTGVSSDEPALKISVWTRPGRAIIMPFNHDGEKTLNPTLRLDWDKLGLTKPDGQEYVAVVRDIRGYEGRDGMLPEDERRLDPEPIFDPANHTIRVPGLAPHSARYIGLRIQRVADRAQHRPRVQQLLAQAGDEVGDDADQATDALLDELGDYGMLQPGTSFHDASAVGWIGSDQPLRLWAWRRGDRVVVAALHEGDRPIQQARITLDLEALNLALETNWQDFLRARHIWPKSEELTFNEYQRAKRRLHPHLEYHEQQVVLPRLAPGGLRVFGLRRYAIPEDK